MAGQTRQRRAATPTPLPQPVVRRNPGSATRPRHTGRGSFLNPEFRQQPHRLPCSRTCLAKPGQGANRHEETEHFATLSLSTKTEGSLHDPPQSPAQRPNQPAGTSRYITSIRHTGDGEPWERQRQTRGRGLRPLPPSANPTVIDRRSGEHEGVCTPATGHSYHPQWFICP